MPDATIDSPAEHATASPPRPYWRWFPIVWLVLLLAVVGSLRIFGTDVDPGVTNTLTIVATVLGAVGIAIWGLILSRYSLLGRLLVVLVASLVVYLPSPIGPVKLILDGDLGFVGWDWRWGQRPDEKLALSQSSETIGLWQPTVHDYPRFLGNGYWAEIKGVQLETDWKTHPPKKLWQQEIGAGWSSFAIVGNYAITQEQRDEYELVTCYEVQTGKIVWTHADPVRWDPQGGGALGYAGPRATPTIHEGKIFVQGATGILNCLDARTGDVIWSHDTLAKHGASNVAWGKSCSPLIVDDKVVVSVGGHEDQSMVAYHIDSGEVAWASGTYQSSYASPIIAELAGVRQVISVDEGFATARRADDGEPLWEYEWDSSSGGGAATSQPVPISGDRLFLSKGYGHGSLLLQISSDDGKAWQVEPAWRGGLKPVMKTKMGNVVIRDGYVYGIDDVNLQCIKLETGKKQWKKRRRPKFGHGQIMLFGDTILILSEVGEVILVEATPKEYRELASMRVFDDSQITWNNPAFSSPYLLVRNAEEAACYELPVKVEKQTELAQK